MEWSLVTVDPSLRNLGIAIFKMKDNEITELSYLGSIQNSKKDNKDWFARCSLMVRAVENIVYSILGDEIFYMITETQENWFGAKGTDSKNAGSIQKLYYFTGALSQAFSCDDKFKGAYGVGPSTWKGQTPKDAMMRRARIWIESRGWDASGYTHDAAEALLIGKYAEKKDFDFNTHFSLLNDRSIRAGISYLKMETYNS